MVVPSAHLQGTVDVLYPEPRGEAEYMATIQVQGYQCERCAHVWAPRDTTQRPARCPKCGSALWDRPRKAAAKIQEHVSLIMERLAEEA